MWIIAVKMSWPTAGISRCVNSWYVYEINGIILDCREFSQIVSRVMKFEMFNPSFHLHVQGAAGECQRTVNPTSEIQHSWGQHPALEPRCPDCSGSQNEPMCHQHLPCLQQNSSQCQTMRPEVLILLSIPNISHPPTPYFPVYCVFLSFSPSPFPFFPKCWALVAGIVWQPVREPVITKAAGAEF